MVKKVSVTLVLMFGVMSMACCSTKQLEIQRDAIEEKRIALEEKIIAEGREPTLDEKFLLEALAVERQAVERIIDKKLEGMSTAGAIAETAVGFLPPPWGEVGGLALALLGIGRARQNRQLAKNIAKASVTAAGDDGVINTNDAVTKRTLSAIMGPAGNSLIAEAKGQGKTLGI